jgi:septal ring factor EnvC (AmiA/AmiB activator)
LIGRALTIIACMGLLAPAGRAQSAPPQAKAKEELRQLKARINAVQKRVSEAEESRTDAADALKKSERAISQANSALSELAEQSRLENTKLASLRRELERGSLELQTQRGSLSKLLYHQYVAGRPEALAILLNGGNPNVSARELHYLGYVGQARSELISKLSENSTRLRQLTQDTEQHSAALSAITAEQSDQRKRLEREKRARAEILTRVSKDLEQERRKIGTLKRDELQITRLMERLARIKPKTPSTVHRGGATVAASLRNDRIPESNLETGAFARLRGALALPVRGELGSRFGSPRQDGGVVWKGLFIAAPAGTEVRAIAAGRVVFADWLRGFGNLLIIDHGDTYMSLYGYNETLHKQVGDVIRGGERVAAVGNSGGHPDSGLYFEMRHEGRPFDPMKWVSVR